MKIEKKVNRSICISLVLFIGISVGIDRLAATEGSEPQAFTLHKAISYALANNPLMQRIRFDRQQSLLYLDEIKAKKILPEFSLSGEMGIVPEARGDIFDSPDKQTDLDGLGPFYKVKIKLVQPIFTFGRIKSAKQAALRGIDLQDLKGDSLTQELIFNVIKTFWALSASKQAETIAQDVQKNYDKLQKEVKKRLNSEDTEIDDTDLLEVKSNRYLIQEIVIKSRSERQIAERAFNIALGRDIMEPVVLSPQDTPRLKIEPNHISRLVSQTLDRHRDIKSLNNALLALQAKTKLAYSKKKPVIYLAGGFAYGYAPNREDQTNPFAVDNFNYTNLGVYLGVEWDLNFFRKNVEARRYQLQKKSMEQNRQLLQSKIQLEVNKAYIDVEKNGQLLEQAEASLKSAKSWLRLSMENWDMGIGEVERLIKAYNSYYQLKGVQIQRSLELNISIAQLAFILGNTNYYMEWIKNGNIEISQ